MNVDRTVLNASLFSSFKIHFAPSIKSIFPRKIQLKYYGKTKITVEGIQISIDDKGYVSLTDIAKGSSSNKPAVTIQS